MRTILTHRGRSAAPLAALVALAGLSLGACGGPANVGAAASSAPEDAHPSSDSAEQAVAADPGVGTGRKEVGALKPRLLMSHADGLALMDADTGKVLSTKDYPAFLRLANAGDGRHVVVSDSDTFRVYDTGIQSEPHGDHSHNAEFTPGLTDTTFDAPHAGHVVLHNARTMLFADGTGAIQAFDSSAIAEKARAVKKYRTDAAHHGVAIELADGSLATTQGTEDERHTVQVKQGDKVVAQTTDCPGVHGEAMAAPTDKGEVLAFGCENGPVVYRDGAFHKVPVKDAYSRSGNLAGHESSPIVLGDYKVDKDAEPVERPTRVALIDTRKDTLKLVDLKSPYWFRSFARGPQGEGLVLTYDGKLHVIDDESGKETAAIPVISSWTEKEEWQEPGPAVKVAGSTAYVSDAEKKTMSVVDLTTRKVVNTYALPAAPVEYAVTTGEPEAPAEGDEHEQGTDEHGKDEHAGGDH